MRMILCRALRIGGVAPLVILRINVVHTIVKGTRKRCPSVGKLTRIPGLWYDDGPFPRGSGPFHFKSKSWRDFGSALKFHFQYLHFPLRRFPFLSVSYHPSAER